MDAVRISDGRRVVMKRTRPSSPEGSIARYLTSLPDHPSNHCVPILDVFSDDDNSNIDYIVMPMLREFYDPPFEVVSEAVDFMKQALTVSTSLSFISHIYAIRCVFKGLDFLHRSRVAHL